MGILDGLLGSIVSAGAAAAQQVAQNAFNASEAEKARAFNSNEAKLAYERSLEADSTKYQRTVADMASAGVNPMMAVSNGAGSSVAAPAASGPAASAASVNLGSLLSAVASQKQAEVQENLEPSQEAVNEATAKKLNEDAETQKQTREESKARTEGQQLYNQFFKDTANLRKMLLEDEHEAYAWKKDVAERGVAVQEAAQELMETNAQHYNDMLDEQKKLIQEQQTTEGFKRMELAANAKEAKANAEYRAAMKQLDEDAKTEENELLRIEVRLKKGIYTEEYIKQLAKEAKDESLGNQAMAQYKRGDYKMASQSLQKMFKKLEKDGMQGTFSTGSQYFNASNNGAAAASALPY